jgi:hypothetical protein
MKEKKRGVHLEKELKETRQQRRSLSIDQSQSHTSILIVLACICLTRLYDALTKILSQFVDWNVEKTLIHPFICEYINYPFGCDTEGITFPTYVYMLTFEIAFNILIYMTISKASRSIIILVFVLQGIYFVDFLLTYNASAVYVLGVKVDSDMIRIWGMGIVILYVTIKKAASIRNRATCLRD